MKNLFLFIQLFICSSVVSQTIKTGDDVIKAMFKKYENTWYKYFTFTQEAIFYKDTQVVKKEIWHEAALFPGNLIIKYDSINSKNGVVFSNYKVTPIKDGLAKETKAMVHDLLLIGFDVYFLKPERTIRLLDSLGYYLKLVREDVFEGRKVLVVGAEKGDDKSNQFWIDFERLYMHRIIYKKNEYIMDVVFANYVLIENKWVAKTVIFKNNGQLQLIENYYNIKLPKALSKDLFNPNKFTESKW